MDEEKNINQEENLESEKNQIKKTKTILTKTKIAEIEKIIIELGKKGETPAKIGAILRDSYGIPKAKTLGKKITQILKENKIPYKDEKKIIKDRVEKLKEHISKNKHDYTASRALTKKLWALHRIENR